MKKTYITPEALEMNVDISYNLLNGSQVQTGGKPGDEYNGEDVTYSRRHHSVWDDEEQEENY